MLSEKCRISWVTDHLPKLLGVDPIEGRLEAVFIFVVAP